MINVKTDRSVSHTAEVYMEIQKHLWATRGLLSQLVESISSYKTQDKRIHSHILNACS